MDVKLTLTGTRALLMHNVRLASPMDPFAKKLAQLNRAKPSSKRTDDDRMEIAKVEWEGGLYFDDEIGPYVPSSWIFRSLLDGARMGRRGPKIEGGVIVKELQHPLLYKGPRTVEDMWANGSSEFVDFRIVRVGQAKVDRCRPIFHQWAVETELLVDPNVISADELGDIATIAGNLKGLGDYRQQFGRFTVELSA